MKIVITEEKRIVETMVKVPKTILNHDEIIVLMQAISILKDVEKMEHDNDKYLAERKTMAKLVCDSLPYDK